MYILSLCHGEWDDFTRSPIAAVEDPCEASLIREAIENKHPDFIELVPEWIREAEFSIDIDEIPLVSI